jgi:hypothetical protein
MTVRTFGSGTLACLALVAAPIGADQSNTANERRGTEYRVLATSRTSTMEKELNDAAAMGFRFAGVMGGDTAFGGQEVVIIMTRAPEPGSSYEYKLLATSKTSTMQKELQQSADRGFEYRGQTVFKTVFGGAEVVVILEHDRQAALQQWEYRLLATSKTSTMQKELSQAGQSGFEYVGLTVGETAVGGSELVVITRRLR